MKDKKTRLIIGGLFVITLVLGVIALIIAVRMGDDTTIQTNDGVCPSQCAGNPCASGCVDNGIPNCGADASSCGFNNSGCNNDWWVCPGLSRSGCNEVFNGHRKYDDNPITTGQDLACTTIQHDQICSDGIRPPAVYYCDANSNCIREDNSPDGDDYTLGEIQAHLANCTVTVSSCEALNVSGQGISGGTVTDTSSPINLSVNGLTGDVDKVAYCYTLSDQVNWICEDVLSGGDFAYQIPSFTNLQQKLVSAGYTQAQVDDATGYRISTQVWNGSGWCDGGGANATFNITGGGTDSCTNFCNASLSLPAPTVTPTPISTPTPTPMPGTFTPTPSASPSPSPTPAPFCGDGVLQPNEECDPGVANSCNAGSVCTSACSCEVVESGCGAACSVNENCPNGHTCEGGVCKLDSCTDSSSTVCAADNCSVVECGGTCGPNGTCPTGHSCNGQNICVIDACLDGGCENVCVLPQTDLESEEVYRIMLGILIILLSYLTYKANLVNFLFKKENLDKIRGIKSTQQFESETLTEIDSRKEKN